MKPFQWIEARSAGQAVAELSRGPDLALLKAGGVDLLDRLKEGLDQPARIVNLARVRGEGLDEIREEKGPKGGPDLLHLGALVTLRRLAQDPLVLLHLPALAKAAAGVATPQVRQVATLGGNLLQRPRCWYLRSALHPCRKKGGAICYAQDGESEHHAIFDNQVCAAVHPSSLATVLGALAGEAQLLGPGGPRRLLLEDLWVSPLADPRRDHALGPAEVLRSVQVPIVPGQRSAYLKVRQKQGADWPLLEVAVALLRKGAAGPGARIVLGAVAPTPFRARAAEELLRAFDDATIRLVVSEAVRGARPLLHNAYKLTLIAQVLPRAIRQALAEAP